LTKNQQKPSTKIVGNAGEDKASAYLLSAGYKIIARNWRTRGGEIDIIVEKDDTLVFVEVKTLPSGNLETLSHELNRKKQKRIIETAKFFLVTNRKYSNRVIRFDVLVIDMPGFSSVYHIKDAFAELV
jgi:putative endonuclease